MGKPGFVRQGAIGAPTIDSKSLRGPKTKTD